MKTSLHLAAPVLLMAAIAGCGGPEEPYTARSMGNVEFDDAFATAKAVISNYFKISYADESTGLIQCEPKRSDEAGLSPKADMRQVATFRLTRGDNGMIRATASIAVQRQTQDLQTMVNPMNEPYSSVPNQTPAQVEAATTPEQNQTWSTIRYATAVENRILSDLYQALHQPATGTSPASHPGEGTSRRMTWLHMAAAADIAYFAAGGRGL